MTTRSYDAKCHALACYFLDDVDGLYTDLTNYQDELAKAIQDAIDDWLAEFDEGRSRREL